MSSVEAGGVTRNLGSFETGNKQRHRDETEQREVWTSTPSVHTGRTCPELRPAEEGTLKVGQGGGRGQQGPGCFSFSQQVSLPESTIPTPQITPAGALDQDAFLMTSSQPFRYFKAFLFSCKCTPFSLSSCFLFTLSQLSGGQYFDTVTSN